MEPDSFFGTMIEGEDSFEASRFFIWRLALRKGGSLNKIELIKNKEAYADYQVKDGMDSIVVGATTIKNLEISENNINR